MAAATLPKRTYAVLLLALALTACSGTAPRPSDVRGTASRSDAARPAPQQRSGRGNPPFYDVLGKRYHVLPTSAGYVQRGVASWYGRDFHGLATSSGETYNMHAMTAAHTTLPLPTWVEVTNLANGKRVVVKVNDRGPFVDNRLIDLSYAAATALDMVRSGTTRVEVRTVAPPRDGSAAAEVVAAAPAGDRSIDLSPPPTPGGTDLLYVQIGAFSEHDNAQRLVARLRASGFANPIVFSEPTDRRRLHRVRLGPIRDSFEFDQLNARLRAIGVSGSQLVVDRGP